MNYMNGYEIMKYVYALRSIGRGLQAGRMFSAVMNMAPPNTRITRVSNNQAKAASEVCQASIMHAAEEAKEVIEGNRDDMAAAFDGTWQKRGYTSLNGVMIVTSFDTGKVLDFECFSKYCAGCANQTNLERLNQHS
jgi:hypothetical protein